MSFLLFGLTGGIASGKSSISRRWKEHGLNVIDADVLARKVVEIGTIGLIEIVDVFGSEYLNLDGSLNRRMLGSVVFKDPIQLEKLELITGPKINYEVNKLCEEMIKEGSKIACYEAATIVKHGHGQINKYKPLVVAYAPIEIRVQRVIKRDEITRDQALLRITAQASEDQLMSASDYIINTDNPKEITQKVIDSVLDEIYRKHGLKPKI